MSVLIIAPPDDEHALTVGAEIERRGGRVDIIDVAAFPERATLSLRFSADPSCDRSREGAIGMGERRLDLDTVEAVWWRRPGYPAVAANMVRPSHRAFAANETYEALGALWATLDALWINDPAAGDRAARKGYQLAVAKEVGLAIPRTLMTNDPDAVVAFVDDLGYRNVVYKTFSSTQDEWRETRLLDAAEVPLLRQVRHAPAIFQEYVPAACDLRVTIIGERVYCAAIDATATAYPVDSRVDIANARIEEATLPSEVEGALLQLVRRLGLVFGAIDLRRTPDDQFVFLEINPAGQFLYIEAATGMAITAGLADALMR